MNKQQLAAKIWASANKMRSKIEANDYKDYILGFVFYKFLCEQQERFLSAEGYSEDDIKQYVNEENSDTVQFVQDKLGCFIAYEHLFSTWIAKGKAFDVSDVRDALSAFSRLISPSHKKVYDNIFDTLQTGLSKLGDSSGTQTRAISDLIHLIDDIPMNGKQDYDVLGFIYEYLIGMFAANAGKKAGEFYTPHEVSLLMSEIIAHHLQSRDEIKIYDPTSGSGSLLINIGQSIAKHGIAANKIKYYAQELKENTYNLTRMNLIMRGINPSDIYTRNADTLEDDWPYFDESDPAGTYDPLYVDAVVSNPPYSQAWESRGKESDPRYSGFGLAPKTKADFAFLLHDLYHLKPNGMMAIVLPHGVLFRGGEEEKIRTALIEKNHIDAIIGLPANIFFGTGIPTIIMILRQKREHSDVLFIDASKEFIKAGKQNKLQAAHIKKITDTFIHRRDVAKFARSVPLSEIQLQGYNLNIPRYVDSSDAAESYDIYATMFGGVPNSELDAFSDYWQALPSLKGELFLSDNTPYSQVKTDNIAQTIADNADVLAFQLQIQNAFANFSDDLKDKLIGKMDSLNIAQTQSDISDDIFKRLQTVQLVNPYTAYQHFADSWQIISADLEMIQTEGKTAIKQVDANMITKKKDGKESEVQEGWLGHILPFDLVQTHLLADDLAKLTDMQNRQNQISAELESILENLSEEDKDSPAINDAGDGFVAAEMAKVLQTALEAEYGKLTKAKLTEKLTTHIFDEDSLEGKLKTANQLLAEEKTLKSNIKKTSEALHIKTKETIENLSDEQAVWLLQEKWITPLTATMMSLDNGVLTPFSSRLSTLAGKYQTTLKEISGSLKVAEQDLADLLGELTGDDFDMQGVNAWRMMLGDKA